MNRDRNRGWKRWVRASAELARKEEAEYNEKTGGLSSYERVLNLYASPNVVSDNQDSPLIIDRRDLNFILEWSRSIANGATKFMNDFLDMSVNNAKSKVLKESSNQLDLEKILRYVDIISRKRELEQILAKQQTEGGYNSVLQSDINKIKSTIQELDSEKQLLDLYFLTDGKNSDAIFDVMYDTKNNTILDDIRSIYSYVKGPDGKLKRSAYDLLYGITTRGKISKALDFVNDVPEIVSAGRDFFKGVSNNELLPTLGSIERISKLGEKALLPLAEVLNAGVRSGSAVANVIPGVKNLVSGVNGLYKTVNNVDRNFIDDFDDITKKAVRSSTPDSYLSNLTYRGESVTREDVSRAIELSKEKLRRLMDDFLFEESSAKAGKVTFLGNTLWSYDPTIDSDWKLQDEQFGDNISDIFTMPTHVLASTASTAQMFKYQVPNMGLEALTSWVLKKYGSSAFLGGPAGAVMKGIATTATVATGLAASTASRDVETADEAISAYEERVIQDATNNGANYEVVQNAIDLFLLLNYPDLLSRSADERLKYGIALGVKTGDRVWDESIKDSRKGLQKLINANNSLALKDYAETLPFLPYTGSLFKNAVKENIFKANARRHFAAKGKRASDEALSRLYRYSGTQERMSHSFIDPQGVIQHNIDKAAKRLIAKDSETLKKLGLISRDVARYAVNRIPYAVWSSVTEGIEEGLQELLKERYKRGEYDDYSEPYSMFDLVEGLSTLSLANGAIGDYFGLNYGDIDNGAENVHKVMNIGLAASLLFSNVRHALTNIPFMDADNSNLRKLIKDVRTSSAVAEMIADDYQRALDYLHAGIFYEMVRRGASSLDISDRLLLMLNNDGQTKVTQQMIDDSKTIAENVEFMYNQKWLADMMKEEGYKKYGAEHKQAILEGAVKITDLQKGGLLTQQLGKDVTNSQLNIQWDIQRLLSESFTEQQRLEFFNVNPWIKHLYDNFDKIYKTYREKLSGTNTSTRLNISKALNLAVKRNNNPTGDKDFAQKAVSTLTKLGVNEQTAREAIDDAISGKEKTSDIARRLADEASPINTREQAFENLANRYFAYLREVALDRALKLSTNDERLLQHTRRNTGLDINTKTLRGVISRLKEIKKDFVERHRKSGFNPELESSVFHKDSGYDWIFDGDEQFDKHVDLLMSWYINGALLPSMRTVAAPYLFGLASASRLKKAVTNSEGKFDLDALINRGDEINARLYGKYQKLNELQKKSVEDALQRYLTVHGDLIELRLDLEQFGISENEADLMANVAAMAEADPLDAVRKYFEMGPEKEESDKKELLDINRKAAKTFILNRLKQSEDRSRIARRVYIDEVMDNAEIEHTDDDVDGLAKDQETAIDVENGQSVDVQRGSGRNITDAELAARRKYNHETERQLSRKQKNQEQIDDTKKQLGQNPGDEGYNDVVQGPNDDSDNNDDIDDLFDDEQDVSDETESGADNKQKGTKLVYDEEDSEPFPTYSDEDVDILDATDIYDVPYDEMEEFGDDYLEEQEAELESLPTPEEVKSEWVEVLDEYLLDLDENGNIIYDGNILPEGQAQYIRTQFLLLDGIDRSWLDQNSVPNGHMSDVQQMKNVNPEYIGNWLANTFFYAVDEKKRFTSLADKGTTNKFNGVELPKEIGTADELSKRLLLQDWLYDLQRKGKVYYIVTLDKGIQSVKKGTDKRDAYTISLVIEDEDKCFLTFLRDLGQTKYKDEETGEIKERNSELWWRNWLVTKNVNVQLVNQEMGGTLSDDHNVRGGQIVNFIELKVRDYLRTQYIARYGNDIGFENYMSGSGPVHNDDFFKSRSQNINTARRMFQKRYALNDLVVLSDDEAGSQINKLRELRNKIIELYTGGTENVPKSIRKDIVPERLLLSNGKIDTMKNKAGLPLYRPLASNDVDILEIEQDFQNGDLVIGYGKGAAAYGNKFAVQNIKANPNTNDGIFNGKGLSGKIYMMIKGLTRDAERVPVMLAEEKFNTLTREKDGVKETRFVGDNGPVTVLDIVNGVVLNVGAKNADGYTYMPSAAEVIFYMLCRRGLFASMMATDTSKSVIDFIINNGERTLFEKRSGWEKRAKRDWKLFNTLTSKLLAWFKDDLGVTGLSIGLPSHDEDGQLIYKLERFSEDELFAPEGTVDLEVLDKCRENRQKCIAAIARQMHWNTDQPTLNDFFSGEKLGFLLIKSDIDLQTRPRSEFNSQEEYLNQLYSILGCPELSFNLRDILSKDNQFRNVSWMIKNGKLKTDASQQIFADPYVFGIGAKNRSAVKPIKDDGVDNDDTDPIIPPSLPITDVGFFLIDPPAIFGTSFVARNQDQRKELVDKWNEKYSKFTSYKMLDRIAVITNKIYQTDWDEVFADDELLNSVISDIVLSVVKKWLAENKDYNVSTDPKDFNILISKEDLEMIDPEFSPIVVQFDTQDNKNAKVSIMVKSDISMEPLKQDTFVSGVYKTITGGANNIGTLNEKKARQWLFEKLGISGYNVWVQKGAIRGANGKLAYGATTLACDVITNKIVAKFMLSQRDGSAGVEYHEAWHYVNLLLHDEELRKVIYKEYAKYNKAAQHLSYDLIEELMADDFMLYMMRLEDKSLGGKIKRFFLNIVDLINLVLNRKKYRQIYKNISNGKYKFAQMNDLSVKDFQNKYGGVAYSEAESENFSIGEYSFSDVYEAVDSIINQILVENRAYGADRIKKLFNDKDYFDKLFIPTVNNMITQAVEARIGMQNVLLLNDLKNNKDLIKAHLAQKFATLGFNVKFTSQVPTDLEERESNPDNTWDKLDISTSRKDGASAKIKMFLSTIPAKELVVDNNMNYFFNDVKTKFGTQKLYNYDEVWGAVVQRLHNVKSYQELRNRIKELAASHAIFNALELRMLLLDSHNDSELKSLLFGICNSHVNHVLTINISNPFEKEWVDEFDYSDIDFDQQGTGSFTNEVLDVTKEWALSDDGAYNPGFTLPRNWSLSLASTSFVHFDTSTQKILLSRGFIYTENNGKTGIYNMIINIDTAIQNHKKSIKKKLGADLEEVDAAYKAAINEIQKRFLALCRVLCIPIDAGVLLHMFINTPRLADTSKSKIQQYYDFVVGLTQDSTRGSVRDVVSKIQSAFDNGLEYINIEGKLKAFDEIYNNLSLQSQIARFAVNYSQVYPKLGEISTRNANGDKIYPVNLNNYVSDKITDANRNPNKFADDVTQNPYNRRSLIAREARHIVSGNSETEFRLNTFVGMKQVGATTGNDYMEMTPMEDYLAKLFLTENDNLVFPTMADKKTWYSLSIGTSSLATKKKIGSTSGFNLSHSLIVNHIPSSLENEIADRLYSQTEAGKNDKSTGIIRKNTLNRFKKDPKNAKIIKDEATKIMMSRQDLNYRSFDHSTIDRFLDYLLDEIDALKHFYSIERIQSVINDPSERIENYDSEVQDGEMLFGGNGGLFRYFYNVGSYNMNHRLQALYEIEQKILKDHAHDDTSKSGEQILNVSIKQIPNKYAKLAGNDSYLYDGFELIREYLDNLQQKVESGEYRGHINTWLIDRVDSEMEKISDKNSPINLVLKINGRFYPKAIPQLFLKPYIEKLEQLGLYIGGPLYMSKDSLADEAVQSALYSLIGNHVVNSMTSVIEIEKVFSGDPAYYSYKYKPKKGEVTYTKVLYTHTFNNGQKTTVSLKIKNLVDPYSDKIKRLGGLLSPGTNLRLDFESKFKHKNKGVVEDVNEIDLDRRTVSKYFSDEKEIDGHSILGTSKYTIVDAEDVKCPSTQLNIVREELKRQTVIDLIHSGVIKYHGSIQDLYYDDLKFDDLYESVRDQKIDKNTTISKYVDTEVDIASDPYTEITVADAQVMIRPALYRKIRIGLGDWSKDDERAYWILETDDKWMEDAEKAKIVRKFQQYVLKMSYFDNDYTRAPVYNKMAIFPIFKFQRSTDMGELLYNRMNLAGNEIDMIAFKSAIKVGATKDGLELVDPNASVDKKTSKWSLKLNALSNKHIDYSNGTVMPTGVVNGVSVRILDLKNLRLQLNTHAHEDLVRSIGTQMFKIGFSNIFDDLPYGLRGRLGKEIREHIMLTINKLTLLGIEEILEQFFTTDSSGLLVIDEESVRKYMLEIIHNNGLGAIAEDIILSGGVVSSLQSRKVFEQSVSKKVNKSVVDINTLGGTAVQQSCFGYDAYESVISDEYVSYNNGKPLLWYKENGSMEVMLSIKFFKSAVPEEHRRTYKEFRQYLIDHDMIAGTKTDGTQSNPKPFGIGYRIPTQGMSSTFVFTVADVLPEETGDLIIVPREFTAQTGSDFDIDKLYLATLSYKDGELEQYDEENPSKNALSNELLLDYMDIIADKKNFYQSRGSIDTFTEILQNDLLPLLKEKLNHYFTGGALLLPWFQAFRKMEFATGKTGIGPYALNVTNLALTQAARLTIDFGENEFGLLPLYSVLGKDNRMISGWLSAMVNAHVDVAKDPYIFALNVNRATYNMCNFLIRTGNGLASFAFIALPILKLYAQQKNAKGGVYGKSLDLGSDQRYDSSVSSKLKERYLNAIEKLIKLSNNASVNKKALAILTLLRSNDEDATITTKFLREELLTTWGSIISLLENTRSLENLRSEEADKLLDHYIHLLLCMYAFEKLDVYAQAMSAMVTASQVDTKKFGNDITSHRVWMNNYHIQRYDSSADWKIDRPEFPEPLKKDGKVDKKARTAQAMDYYFGSLFLEKKLVGAIGLTKKILSGHIMVATDSFDVIFTDVMRQIFGEKTFTDYSSGSENGRCVALGWDKVYDKNKPSQIANALDNVCRFYALFNLSSNVENGLVDLTVGKNPIDLIEKLRELYFGVNDTPSIFLRGADLINKLNAVHDKQSWRPYVGIVTIHGKIINSLLNYLAPMTASLNHKLGRFLLRDSSFETGLDIKSDLRVAWLNLINHPNEEVSNFAKDLILYAYYSKYDQNSPGSFFDLVPEEYRKQYDDALKTAMIILNDETSPVNERLLRLFGENYSLDRIMDIMSRNYWYDDDVVKSYNYHDDEFDETRDIDIFDKAGGETVAGGWYYDNEASQSFPGMVITTRTNLPYFKLKKNNVVYLYRKVGVVHRTNRDISKANGSDVNIYAVTPKAGLREKNNMLFEFYADRQTDSIFDENMLPKQFGEDVLKELLMNRINLYNKSNSLFILSIDWDNIPQSRMSTNLSAYTLVDSSDAYFNGNQVKNTSIVFGNIGKLSGLKDSSVIINVSLDPNAENSARNINLKFKDKAVTIQYGQPLTEEQILLIKDIIDNDEEQTDKKHIVHFVTDMYDNMFYKLDVLPKHVVDRINVRIEEIKKENLEKYRKELEDDGVEKLTLDELIKLREEEFNPGEKQYNFAKSQAGIEIATEYINRIVQDLLASGVRIERLTTSATKSNTIMSLGASHAANISTRDIRNTVYCNEAMPQTDRSTYSTLIGKIGRIVKLDLIIIEESLRDQQLLSDDSVIQALDNLNDELLKTKLSKDSADYSELFDDDEYDISDDEDYSGFIADINKESAKSEENKKC